MKTCSFGFWSAAITAVLPVLVAGNAPLESGVYSFQLSTTGCFLSYQNRTCARSVAVVRPETVHWRQWTVSVVDADEGFVTLRTGDDPDRFKCSNGTLRRSVNDLCRTAPSATLGLVEQASTPPEEQDMFKLVTVEGSSPSGSPGEGLYRIMAVGKSSECALYVGAKGCGRQGVATQLAADGEEGILTTWKLSPIMKEVAPVPSILPPSSSPSPSQAPAPTSVPAPAPAPAPSAVPAPAPAPTPSPPAQPITGPTIETSNYGQSITTSGSIDLTVKSVGGNSGCSVVTISLTTYNKDMQFNSTGGAHNVVNLLEPITVVLPPSIFPYEVYAVGTCSDGRTTERSNVLDLQTSFRTCLMGEISPIPGGNLNASPAFDPCYVAAGQFSTLGRLFRRGPTRPPPTCGSTPWNYHVRNPWNPGGNSLYYTVVYTLKAPPSGTCVTVTLGLGTCPFTQIFPSLWAGEFPIGPGQRFPSSSSYGNARYQNDPGTVFGVDLPLSFTMPAGYDSFSILLQAGYYGQLNCRYGDIDIAYSD